MEMSKLTVYSVQGHFRGFIFHFLFHVKPVVSDLRERGVPAPRALPLPRHQHLHDRLHLHDRRRRGQQVREDWGLNYRGLGIYDVKGSVHVLF